MGVLDEAIREHLELKRRGGADPREVALLEHEALGGGIEGAGWADEAHDGLDEERGEPRWLRDDEHAERQAPAVPASANQETMEIDMGALLGVDEEISAERLQTGSIAARDARPESDELDGLAWESPAHRAQRPRRFRDGREGYEEPVDKGPQASWL